MTDQQSVAIYDFSFLVKKRSYYTKKTCNLCKKQAI